MPEMPEVEGFRKYFEETSLNKKITETELLAPKMLKGTSPSELKKHTEGYKFTSAVSHGKYFFAGISSKKYLMLHFGMTGYLIYYKLTEDATKHIRLQFKLQNGFYIAYDNLRKFGQIMLIDDVKEFIDSRKLGIDPLKDNLNLKNFNELTDNKSGTVKSILMDQSIFSGIGNLYSDEIAFHSYVHPAASFKSLPAGTKKELHKNMITVLKAAIKKEGQRNLLPKKYLLNHRAEGDECPLCGGEITHKTIAGRTSYFCKSHQKI